MVHVSFQNMVFPEFILGSEIVGSYNNSVFRFFRNTSVLFSVVAVPIVIITQSVGGFPFIEIFSSLFQFCKLFDGYSYWCEVVPLVCISLIVMMSIFSCTYWPFICLWRNVCLGLLPIFYWVVLFFVIEIYELILYFGN